MPSNGLVLTLDRERGRREGGRLNAKIGYRKEEVGLVSRWTVQVTLAMKLRSTPPGPLLAAGGCWVVGVAGLGL